MGACTCMCRTYQRHSNDAWTRNSFRPGLTSFGSRRSRSPHIRLGKIRCVYCILYVRAAKPSHTRSMYAGGSLLVRVCGEEVHGTARCEPSVSSTRATTAFFPLPMCVCASSLLLLLRIRSLFRQYLTVLVTDSHFYSAMALLFCYMLKMRSVVRCLRRFRCEQQQKKHHQFRRSCETLGE